MPRARKNKTAVKVYSTNPEFIPPTFVKVKYVKKLSLNTYAEY